MADNKIKVTCSLVFVGYTLKSPKPKYRAKIRRQVMKDSITIVGMDVHKNSISIALGCDNLKLTHLTGK